MTTADDRWVWLRGRVKWFNPVRGFGFIAPLGGGDDVFVHHTAIEMLGYRLLAPLEEVEYVMAPTSRGLQAARVRRADVPAAPSAPPTDGQGDE